MIKLNTIIVEIRYKKYRNPSSIYQRNNKKQRNLRRLRETADSASILARMFNRRCKIAACLKISRMCENRAPLRICIALTRGIDSGAILYKDSSPSRVLTDGTILDPSAIPRDSPLGSFRDDVTGSGKRTEERTDGRTDTCGSESP